MMAKDCTGREIKIGDWVVENPNFPRMDNNFAVWRECRVSAIRPDGHFFSIEATDSNGNKVYDRDCDLKILGR